MNLRRFGEDRLIEALGVFFAGERDIVLGAGDDCAIVKQPAAAELLVLKTDCVVEGIHFEPRAHPERVGWKAMMRPMSDFAAVAARPRFALVTLIVPATASLSWVRSLYRGMKRAANKCNVAIVGGETSETRGPAAVSVSVIGVVEKNRYVTRSGGRPNDELFVTGKLGGTIRGKHLKFVARIEEARWLSANFRVHAMMDLSDGLGADLPRLAKASKVGYTLEFDALPLNRGCDVANAVNDGEDYELIFAVSPRDRDRLERAWRKRFPKVRLTRIGSLTPRSKKPAQKSPGGYVHFQKRR